jgi:hypothetical protein
MTRPPAPTTAAAAAAGCWLDGGWLLVMAGNNMLAAQCLGAAADRGGSIIWRRKQLERQDVSCSVNDTTWQKTTGCRIVCTRKTQMVNWEQLSI